MTDLSVTVGIAFIAGMASFFSPCILPLMPAYIGYLGGRTAANADNENRINRADTFFHGIAFVMGFSLVFILLGTAIAFLGWLLYEVHFWLVKIGGIIVIIFGIHLTGMYRFNILERDLRPQSREEKRVGFLSSMMMGVFFSAGWSPCIGPILGSIMALAMSAGTAVSGALLLSAYSTGFAIPFLLTALGIGWMIQLVKKYRGVLMFMESAAGWVLILIGVLLFFDMFSKLSLIGSIGSQ